MNGIVWMKKKQQILVVEDEAGIRKILRVYLESAGFAVATVDNGPEALAYNRENRPDLIILDLNLPGMDGLDIAVQLRAESDVYILMLTARGEVEDRIKGLRLGADDYVIKPFSPRELVARVGTVLRRSRRMPKSEPARIEMATLTIDNQGYIAQIYGQDLDLTATEFQLLWELAAHTGRVLSREQLLAQVWGTEFVGSTRVVDVYIGQLRRKISAFTDRNLIETIRGVGYKFVDQEAD